jgi:RNA polymerase sigma-70 factor (ECF subfamily)
MREHSTQNSYITEEFLRLLGKHESSLRTYILALVLNWNDAEDLAQEVRMRLWQQFSKYDRTKDFGAWARSIAYYVVLAHRKTVARRKRQFSMQFVALMHRQFEVAESHEQSRRDALACCLEKLTDRHRELVSECYVGGTTIKDVAVRTGRSIRGLQQTVARIRALLQECVEAVLAKETGCG